MLTARDEGWPRRALLGTLAAGALVRVWGYLTAGSLWLDELFLVDNLRRLSPQELFGPLENGQYAPVGWLLGMKLVFVLLGDAEWALRLPALCASLASLPLAYRFAKRVVGPAWALVPLWMLAFSPFVIWQALQLKQYSFDLLVGLLLLNLALAAESFKQLARLGGAGLLAVWLSMPAVFVLAGIALTLLAVETGGRRRAAGVLGALWAAAFAANYLLLLRPREQPGWLYEYWASGLLPWPLEGWGALDWLRRVVAAALENPAGLIELGEWALLPSAAALLFWAADGLRRRPGMLAPSLAAAPVLLALGAAACRLYPFSSRLLLFLVPNLGVLLALGLRRAAHALPWSRWPLRAAAVLLLLPPLLATLLWLPRGGLPVAAESRELFETVRREHRPGDVLVLDHLATYAWRTYGFEGPEVVEVPSAWTDRERAEGLRRALARTARRQEHRRAWVVITRVISRRHAPLGESLRRDFRARDLAFPETWGWLVGSQTAWTPLARFAPAVPGRWRLVRQDLVYGGCLWLLEREESPTPADEDSE